MRKIHLMWGSWLLLLALSVSCSGRIVQGSGNLVAEDRPVSNFERIHLSGSGEVIVIQDGAESLVVETDDNILEYVVTDVRGGTLVLGFEPMSGQIVNPTQLTFTVHVDTLDRLDVSGSGVVTADTLTADNLELDVSGSGEISLGTCAAEEVRVHISGSGAVELAGEGREQDIDISGSGNYLATDFESSRATINVSGSGDAALWVSETLDASISGSGSVSYYGNPQISSTGSGSGSLEGMGFK